MIGLGFKDKEDVASEYKIVSTKEEADDLFRTGTLNRKVSATSLNDKSSRSHLIFTLQILSE